MKIPALPQGSMSAMTDPEACLIFADCNCRPGEKYANTDIEGTFCETLDEVLAAYRAIQSEWKWCRCHLPPRPMGRRYGALHLRNKHILKIDLPGYGSVGNCFAVHNPPWPHN